MKFANKIYTECFCGIPGKAGEGNGPAGAPGYNAPSPRTQFP